MLRIGERLYAYRIKKLDKQAERLNRKLDKNKPCSLKKWMRCYAHKNKPCINQ